MPSALSWATLRCVAGFSHISTFIAGASTSGQRRATHSAASRSSARPCTTRAMKSAVAGATTTKPRSRDSSMCPIESATRASHRSVHTGWPDSACRVAVPMKRVAASVIATRTSAPALISRRVSSAAL
jgi:hypothetical protein